MLADMLEESGARMEGWYDHAKALRSAAGKRFTPWMLGSVESRFARVGLMRVEDGPLHRSAVAFQSALDKIRIEDVPVLTTERVRSEAAKLLRGLFTRLGLKGASVTVDSRVEVRIPARRDEVPYSAMDDASDAWHKRNACPAVQANREAERKVREIISRALPNCDDRSDRMTDYYDYVWTVDSAR